MDSWGLEPSAATTAEINKISMQIRQPSSCGCGGHWWWRDAERLTEFTTRWHFVRTDASREITLVSPLAASGRCGGRRRAAVPYRRCLLSCQVALVSSASTVNRRLFCREQHQRQQQTEHHRRRVCFSMIYTCTLTVASQLVICSASSRLRSLHSASKSPVLWLFSSIHFDFILNIVAIQ